MKKEKKEPLLKKEKPNRFLWAGACFSLLFLTFPACRIRRDTTASFRSDRTDSLTFVRADSVWSTHLEHLSGHSRLQWRQIRLSLPDSAGLQYPVSLTAGSFDNRKEEIRQDSVRHFTHRQSTATRQEKKEEESRQIREQNASSFRGPLLRIGAIVLLGGMSIAWIRRRKRKNR